VTGQAVREVDFVAVGHVTLDQVAGGVRPGGAAYYAAVTAHRLGLRVGLLTAFGSEFPAEALPPDADVVNVGAERTTVYRVEESGRGRTLTLLARASEIEEGHLPLDWRGAPMALLCPVAGEVDPALAGALAESSLGVAPQGWMRARGAGGAITPQRWEDADLVVPHAQALVVSVDDIEAFEKEAIEWFQQVPLAAVTRGREGATLFVNGEPYHVEADPASEVDAVGAGDVFAAALLIEYQRESNPWEAAAAAACCAAAAVEAAGVAGIPDRAALEARLRRYRRRQAG
jgi:sugar/nucleoside kinase (ribokinase family)